MLDYWKDLDNALFGWINQSLTHPWLDSFFVFVTDLHKHPIVFVPLLVLILGASVWKFRSQSWRVVVGLALALTLSDMFSYRVLKSAVYRPRPFQSERWQGKARQLTDAHGNSFPSNHAANCFAAAFILGICFPRGRYFFYIIAAIVGYSRIYLGVHYPSDVIGGACVGVVAGFLASIFTVLQLKHWSKQVF